jgi:hypothetical protein
VSSVTLSVDFSCTHSNPLFSRTHFTFPFSSGSGEVQVQRRAGPTGVTCGTSVAARKTSKGGAQDKQGAACRTSGAVHMASRGDAQVRQQGTGAALALPRAVPAAMHRCRQRLDEATEDNHDRRRVH